MQFHVRISLPVVCLLFFTGCGRDSSEVEPAVESSSTSQAPTSFDAAPGRNRACAALCEQGAELTPEPVPERLKLELTLQTEAGCVSASGVFRYAEDRLEDEGFRFDVLSGEEASATPEGSVVLFATVSLSPIRNAFGAPTGSCVYAVNSNATTKIPVAVVGRERNGFIVATGDQIFYGVANNNIAGKRHVGNRLTRSLRSVIKAVWPDTQDQSESSDAATVESPGGEASAAASEEGEFAQPPNAITRPSGLSYVVLEEGSGASPSRQDRVSVHYRGALMDGTVFDSSYERGTPAELGVGQVIEGWSEALQLMKVGDRWKVWIPSELAYGSAGAGSRIPPNADLVFEIKLLEII